ncbi:MAG TPA: two-component regulator propeller domain-containing protein [Kiritimatiellia bacterium]|nr:two-component regulator propeller domain-containing protein [Kiritimatiellia bacterium]
MRRDIAAAVAEANAFVRTLVILWICAVVALAVRDVQAEPSLLAPAFANDYTSTSWGLDDGLSDSQVCGVIQGQDGYLWVVTARSLLRFDGRGFANVALPSQTAVGRNEGVFQDSRGGVWVFGYLGVVRHEKGVWWQSEKGGVPRGRVTSVAETADGTVYFSQERRVFAWHNGDVKAVLDASAFPEESVGVRQMVVCDGGTLWMAVGYGLWRWVPESGQPPERMTGIRSEWVLGIDADGALVAHGSFVCMRRVGERWERMPMEGAVSARCLLAMPDKTLWLGHDAGIDVFAGGTWHGHGSGFPYGATPVLDFARDREGNVWLATSGQLIRISRRVLRPVPIRGLADRRVSAVWVESDGRAWAGLHTGGLAVGNWIRLEPQRINDSDFARVVPQALYVQSGGTVWCGGADGNVWRVSGSAAERIDSANAGAVHAIAGLGGVPLWVATSRGLLTQDPDKGHFEELAWPVDPVLSLWLERDGVLWVGHESLGLAVLYSGVRDDFLPDTALPGRAVRTLYRDSDGVLWIGGQSGLARWANGSKFVFRREHGLWNESVRQIAEDAGGGLWIGSADGLMRIEKRDLAAVADGRAARLAVRTFGTEAGFGRDKACVGGVFFPVHDPHYDRLWFPTAEGLYTVETRALPPLRPAPEVRVTAVGAGRLVRPRVTDRLHTGLPDAPRDVMVGYTALDFTAPERVGFRYELKGPVVQHCAWTETRRVRFERLPPGSYRFRVMACNGDGVWNMDGATAEWEIKPFFWETVWFKLACLFIGGCVLAGAAVFSERRRMRQRLLAAARREELSNERARIARDLHDEIGAKLTKLALLGDMAAEDAKDNPVLRRVVEEMAGAARLTHRAFDEIVWSVSPRNDTVRRLSHYMCKYAEEFFAKTEVRCLCYLPNDLPDMPLHPRCRHQMFLAVKEGLNNVLKHASARQVTINVMLRGGCLRVEVTDDGQGFDLDEIGEVGEGIRNMQERMKAARGQMFMQSKRANGTCLVFEMPVDKEVRE